VIAVQPDRVALLEKRVEALEAALKAITEKEQAPR